MPVPPAVPDADGKPSTPAAMEPWGAGAKGTHAGVLISAGQKKRARAARRARCRRKAIHPAAMAPWGARAKGTHAGALIFSRAEETCPCRPPRLMWPESHPPRRLWNHGARGQRGSLLERLSSAGQKKRARAARRARCRRKAIHPGGYGTMGRGGKGTHAGVLIFSRAEETCPRRLLRPARRIWGGTPGNTNTPVAHVRSAKGAGDVGKPLRRPTGACGFGAWRAGVAESAPMAPTSPRPWQNAFPCVAFSPPAPPKYRMKGTLHARRIQALHPPRPAVPQSAGGVFPPRKRGRISTGFSAIWTGAVNTCKNSYIKRPASRKGRWIARWSRCDPCGRGFSPRARAVWRRETRLLRDVLRTGALEMEFARDIFKPWRRALSTKTEYLIQHAI